MSSIGYARVSSYGQSLQVQQEKLNYCDRIFQEKQSARTDDREQLQLCLDYVRDGDSLVITKLDRLALCSSDADIQKALKKGQKFYADWDATENLHFDDWWRTHRNLFHDDKVVRLHRAEEMMTEDNIYVTVPRGKSYGDMQPSSVT